MVNHHSSHRRGHDQCDLLISMSSLVLYISLQITESYSFPGVWDKWTMPPDRKGALILWISELRTVGWSHFLLTCSGTCKPWHHTEKTTHTQPHSKTPLVFIYARYLGRPEPSTNDFLFLVIPSHKRYIIPGSPQITCEYLHLPWNKLVWRSKNQGSSQIVMGKAFN